MGGHHRCCHVPNVGGGVKSDWTGSAETTQFRPFPTGDRRFPRNDAMLTTIPMPDLPAIVRQLVNQIPAGKVCTFGDIAEALGDLSAARWVAQELAATSPGAWHRVVKRTGEFTGTDTARTGFQSGRLRAEGIDTGPDGKLTLSHYRWHEFECEAPLQVLAQWQDQVAARADCTTECAIPAVIGGLDVSYATDREAVAAYVEVDTLSGAVLFSTTVRAAVQFPYVTGYLTFRELPVHLELLRQVREQKPLAPVVLVDGAGRLHPRRCGIAVAVGVIADCVTIGVAKHHLCGHAGNSMPDPLVEFQGEHLGQMLYGTNRKHPQYVSPGHGITLSAAVRCVRAVWPSGRSPIPIQAADQLSRRAAKEPL